MAKLNNYFIFLLMMSMFHSISGDWSAYHKFYENMITRKGETYSYIVNYLFTGVEAVRGQSKKFNEKFNTCLLDITTFQKAVQERQFWALKMLDSSTQLPSGFLEGNIVDLGNFKECIEIESTAHNIRGQYCSVFFFIENPNPPALSHLINIKQSICVPSSCLQPYLRYIFQSSPNAVNHTIAPAYCQTKESISPRIGLMETFILFVFGVLGVIVLIGTGYDILANTRLRQWDLQNPWIDKTINGEGDQKFKRAILAFSLVSNVKDLVKTDTSEKSIKCLYGLRFISACFILSIHRMIFDPQPISNYFALDTEMRKWYRSIQLNAYLFVDLFFVMSGLLLSYKHAKRINDGEKLNLIGYYLHRYIRLTPPLLVCIMLDLMLGLLCDGPNCQSVLIRSRNRCIDNAKYTVTYLNNFFKTDRKCLPHCWYLSADMQLYCLAPLLFFFIKRCRRSMLYVLLLCLATNIFITFGISYYYGFKSGYMQFDELHSLDSDLIYYPFYTRMGPWIIGFGLGLILQHFSDKQLRLSKRIVTIGWIFAVLCILFAVFGVYPFVQYDFQHDRLTDSLYKATYRNFFGLGCAWLIYACHSGYSDCLNNFLSMPGMQVLGKLSYSFFLIHPFVILLQYRSVSEARKYSDFLQGSILLGDISYALVFAVVLYLTVEAPTLKLEMIFLEKRSNSESDVGLKSNRQVE